MDVPKDLKVLIVSNGRIETGVGSVFHCLAGLRGVRCVNLENSVEMYKEAPEGGWDAVIIDCNSIKSLAEIAERICEHNPEQEVILLHTGFTCIEDFDFALGVPRTAEALKGVLEHQIGLAS